MPKSPTGLWFAFGVFGIPIPGLVLDNHLDGVALVLVEQIVDCPVRASPRTAASPPPLREDGHDEDHDKDKNDYSPDDAWRVIRIHPPDYATTRRGQVCVLRPLGARSANAATG